jgi:mannosyltransferase OCH1-like enzyme
VIPKKIHYFWFSGDPFPENIKRCMASWKNHLPDYEIVKWDLTNMPIEGEFAKKALAEKKWAFLSDYARLRILHEYGGIYLDTDVLVVKSFNELLSNASFWGKDLNGFVEPVVIGTVPENELIGQCLERYVSGALTNEEFIPIPKVIAPVFKKYGFKLNNELESKVENLILNHHAFCPMPFEQADSLDPLSFKTKNTYAIHLWNAAWFDPFRFFWNGRSKKGWQAVWKTIRRKPTQSREFYRNVFYHMKCAIFGYPT